MTPPALARMSGTTRLAGIVEDAVGVRRGRAVGALDDHRCADVKSVAAVDDALDCRRDQQVHVGVEERSIAERVGTGEADDRPGVVDMVFQRRDVQAAVGGDGAVLVGDRDDADPGIVQEPGSVPADFAEPLHRRGGVSGRIPREASAAKARARRLAMSRWRAQRTAEATGLPVVTPRTVWPCCTE